jgi:succinate dehydrogenase / fumarate reductase, iron-sulfur subunit
MSKQTFILRILRGTPQKQYWEEFPLSLKPYYNITSALMDIQKNPVNCKGEKVTPVAWEQGCLEEVCGSCSMLINSKPRQACTALIEPLLKATSTNFVIVAPMTKFPLVKDLVVDRNRMFQNLIKVRGWIDVDDPNDRGYGPKISPKVQEVAYELSTCMTCGCCTEACPQINNRSDFIGPAAISQARLFNMHPVGKLMKEDRTRALMGKGGVSECGNAQNCVEVCPKNIRLTESIAVMGREVSKQGWRDLISLPDRDTSS